MNRPHGGCDYERTWKRKSFVTVGETQLVTIYIINICKEVDKGYESEIKQEVNESNRELHGGCQVNGPKVAKFLDR